MYKECNALIVHIFSFSREPKPSTATPHLDRCNIILSALMQP